MHVTRLRLTNLRQHRSIEQAGLSDGLNLFVGPNGVGKSSLVAAVRAAFLERYNTSKVEDLQGPDHGSGATVEIDFESGGKLHALSKTFLKKSSCVLDVDGERLREDAAESYLANLLGYAYAAKGASKDEHWGIPGLLWVQQGSGQSVHEAVRHAASPLRGALQATVQELASTEGDALIARVAAQRNLLLRADGKARGRYDEAIKARAQAERDLQEVEATAEQFRAYVDRIGALERELAALDHDTPWVEAEQRAGQALDALAAIEAQAAELERKREEARRLGTTQALITQRLAELDEHARELRERVARLPALQDDVAAQATALERWDATAQEALDAHGQARGAEASAVDGERRRSLAARRSALEERLKSVQGALADARQDDQRARELRVRIAELAPAATAVPALAGQHDAINTLRARLEGAASAVHFDLDAGVVADVGGRPVSGRAAVSITEPTVIALPGLGSLTVLPGGNDVAACRAQLIDAQEAWRAALIAAGVASLDEARTALRQRDELHGDLKQAQARLAILAPAGLAELEASALRYTREFAETDRQLAALPDAAETSGSLEDARRAREAAENELRRQRDEQGRACASHAAAVEALRREREEADRLRVRVEAPERVDERRTLEAQLLEAGAHARALEQACNELSRCIDSAMPDQLRQDAKRFGDAARLQREHHDRLDKDLRHARTWVESQGALGVDEQVAVRRRDLEQAERRVVELARHARAWDRLHALLLDERRQLTQQLQAPLQRRFDHYLRLLFPNGGLQVDDGLAPRLLRTDVRSAGVALDFDALSFGTREQIGILSRLAYADLLKEAGRPALLIFDDVLVHSDGVRLDAMKRVLFDAATRHQILLLSCHPERWRDLGVPMRRLEPVEA